MIEYNENFDDNSILQSRPRTIQFCYNLIVNLFEKEHSPYKQEFPEVKKKRQILDHYLKGVYNVKLDYGIFTCEIVSPKPNHISHQIQKDNIDIELSKAITNYIKNILHQNSQRANSIFTNDVFFSNIYSYSTTLELEKNTK